MVYYCPFGCIMHVLISETLSPGLRVCSSKVVYQAIVRSLCMCGLTTVAGQGRPSFHVINISKSRLSYGKTQYSARSYGIEYTGGHRRSHRIHSRKLLTLELIKVHGTDELRRR